MLRLIAYNVWCYGMPAYAVARFWRVYYSTCYLPFIFFVIIFNIFLKKLVCVNILIIFTSELKTTTLKNRNYENILQPDINE